MIDLYNYFRKDKNLLEGILAFFADEIKLVIHNTCKAPIEAKSLLGNIDKEGEAAFGLVKDIYFVGLVDERNFSGNSGIERTAGETFRETIVKVEEGYPGLLVFAIDLTAAPDGSQISCLARAFSKAAKFLPVVLIARHRNRISWIACETPHTPEGEAGESVGKVSLLKEIDIENVHRGQANILKSLSVESLREHDKKNKVNSFEDFYKGWQKVFAADVLNAQFYRDFQALYREIIREIFPQQIGHKLQAHQGALNLLNRCMFIYFVQQKGWLMNDKSFLFHFWQDYQKYHQEDDTFHPNWLNRVFYAAFNSRELNEAARLPEKYREAILKFPYFNGALFIRHQEIDGFLLKDATFKSIFYFLESFVFAISEESFDKNVSLEINPALLGKMYEGMINTIDLDDVDAENGIVYTERPEINFMTRRSMVEVLDRKLNSDKSRDFSRDFLYYFCFDKPGQRLALLRKYSVDGKKLRDAILSTRACDPACGAGSMLLGMVQLQMELLKDLYIYQGAPLDAKASFYLKKKLIADCIYGVDIKEWAVRIAELRLWLYLIADAEFTAKELAESPLLPNLDFKLRCGNSLLQKIGDMDFSLESLLKGKNKQAGPVKKLNDFILKKKAFICDQGRSELTYETLKAREMAVFKEFIREQIHENRLRIEDLNIQAEKEVRILQEDATNKEGISKENRVQKEIEALEKEINQLELLKAEIDRQGKLPFSYDIDFMEIFLMPDDPGFDLMIGNPPYVRHELILPPEEADYLDYLLKEENKAEKAAVNAKYKEALSRKVFDTYPFLSDKIKIIVNGKTVTKKVYGEKVPGRSDLFVYFQLLSPQYLNSKGTLCFIISGAWLDADYGSFVQQFLLKHTHLQVLYDCAVRSFEASVNTIIYLHPALKNTATFPSDAEALGTSNEKVKFIMHKTDYANVAYAPLLIAQENCEQNTQRNLYNLVSKTQAELFKNGYEAESQRYAGDKWGAKYLRAPQVYFTILEKGKGKLVPLKELASVRFGVKTGANDFFYLPNKAFVLEKDKEEDFYRLIPKSNENSLQAFELEKEYLKPIFFSLKEADCPDLSLANIGKFYFSAQRPKELLGRASAYITWGEERGFHKTATCSGRRPQWYSLDANFKAADFIFPSKVGERFMLMDNRAIKVLEDKKQYGVIMKQDLDAASFLTWCNSTLYRLMVEQLSPQLTGAQAISDITTIVFKESPVLDLRQHSLCIAETHLNSFMTRKQKSVFIELGFDKQRPIRAQEPNPLADRKILDDAVFDSLNLSEMERKEVYWATAELVKQRLDKANTR